MKGILFFLATSVVLQFGWTQETKSFELNGIEILVTGIRPEISFSVATNQLEQGLGIANIVLSAPKEFKPENISLKWNLPSSNIAGHWSTSALLNKTISPDWGPSKVTSMLARHSPVISLFGHDDVNQLTFAVSDALNTVHSSTSIKEENGRIYNEVKLFSEKHEPIDNFEIQLLLDSRPLNYAKVLGKVNEWWESFELYQPAHVPEAAKLPVYSTWYSYHQKLDREALLEECKKARSMGYKTLIVDDGWQTLDSNRGYAFTGDWLPERIPDMEDLVKKVHELDMKFVLWYAVPFVGEKSKAYQLMKGKFLSYWEGQGAYVLDPRYPEVRSFIISTYVNALKKWNLDGFKLDFIGRFRANNDTDLTALEGRDYASVNKATDRLMSDLIQSLTTINPEILIEFRQPYTGPLMKKYGNMLRASDCPNVALLNRVETTDLRLVSGKTPVHSDMIMWHYEEPVEVAALQFLNVLFSVPQISVRLEDIPREHVEMIGFYSEYWLKNQKVLLEGDFFPKSPLMNYPVIESYGDQKRIVALYRDEIVELRPDGAHNVDIVNAKLSNTISLRIKREGITARYSIFDCKGNLLENAEITMNPSIMEFNVPPSGMMELKIKSN